MAFSDQFLDELRGRVGLIDVIGRRVKLTRRGREYLGLCPFHKEKTPSFTVNEEKGFYHCFGCQAHGSIFDFVMETEGLNFPEAVEKLAAETGMEVPRETPEARENQKQRQNLFDVTEIATTMFEKALRMPQGKEARDYLFQRGLSEETIRRFRLGFAPSGRHHLRTALARKGVDPKLAIAAGLLVEPDDGDPYDRFRNRVIFPICDRRGRVVAFGGRTLREGQPKYLNSPETPLFHKGQTLYGMHLAGPAARRAETMLVTEGYMDVIVLAQAGFEHTVAPLGTALTQDQIQLLWKVTREPILCFDGDNAGQRAAAKAAKRALPHLRPGLGLRFAVLPTGEDPDTLVSRQGLGAMQTVLDAALPLSELLWRNETGGRIPSSAEDRAAIEYKLNEHTREIQDSIVRAHFSRVFGERLWPQQGASGHKHSQQRRSWSKRGAWAPNIHITPNETVPVKAASERHEELLLAVVINHPSAMDDVGEDLGTMRFSLPELDNARQEALKVFSDNPGLERSELITHLIRCGHGDVVNCVLGIEAYSFARSEAPLDQAVSGWKELFRRRQRQGLIEEIEEAKRASQENPSPEARARLDVLIKQKLRLDEEESASIACA